MSTMLTGYILSYGYLAIFCIIFLQEMGVPGLPNELVLFYFGYISHQTGLSYLLVTGIVIIADMAGSLVLFLLFYYGKDWLTGMKPKWLRIPEQRITRLRHKIHAQKGRNILIAKLTPIVRGYLPVVAGLLQVDQVLYGRTILLSACIWSGGWVTAGWLLHL